MTQIQAHDPRSVARDIPGIFDSIFPQLTPGVVAHFNRTAKASICRPVSNELIQESALQKAMLFELAFAIGEKMLAGKTIDWDECLQIATIRQRRHFDAKVPQKIFPPDLHIAESVGTNMALMVSEVAARRRHPVVLAPLIPGFQWISSGHGDASVGSALIEIKCSGKNFSASDYRQIVMYWLLSFAASVEVDHSEWSEGILLNPRSAQYVTLNFDDFLQVISAGRTKVEILQLFSSMVGTRDVK